MKPKEQKIVEWWSSREGKSLTQEINDHYKEGWFVYSLSPVALKGYVEYCIIVFYKY